MNDQFQKKNKDLIDFKYLKKMLIHDICRLLKVINFQKKNFLFFYLFIICAFLSTIIINSFE